MEVFLRRLTEPDGRMTRHNRVNSIENVLILIEIRW